MQQDGNTAKLSSAGDASLFSPLFDELVSAENESSYRYWNSAEERILNRNLILVLLLIMSMFAYIDLQITDHRENIEIVLLARWLNLALFIAAFVVLSKPVTVKLIDRLVSFLYISVAVLILLTDYYRPIDYFAHIGMDVAFIYLCYLASPVTAKYRLLIAATFSCSALGILFFHKDPVYNHTYASYVTSILFCNLTGFFISVRHGRTRRLNYLALLNERKAREEIKTLKGIIPICAYCNNIRSDEGSWRRLEAYIHDHTDAQLSHGICPDCKLKLVGD